LKKALLIIAVVTLVAAGWLIYFSSDSTTAKVSAVTAEQSDISIKIELTGEVAPKESYSVMSLLSGKISKLYVSEGSRVKKGDMLLKLEDSAIASVLPEGLQSQQSDALSAMAGANAAAATEAAALSKAKIALALSQTTGIDYQSFNEAFASEAEEKAEAASAALSSLLPQDASSIVTNNTNTADSATRYSQKSIYQSVENELTQKSRMSGRVLKVNLTEGEILAAGAPAMIIADDSELKILCYINETDLKKIRGDLPVNIITRADNLLYKGSIQSISQAAAKPSGDNASMEALGALYIQPQNGFQEIIGSSVDVEIILDEAKSVLCLPQECLTGGDTVYVIGSDNILQKRAVTTGLADGYNVQILSGVQKGEQVVINPKDITDKQKVKIVD
jgi:multidrug efflux pump subunit AcrA (membrane-fusion protein)